MRAYILFIVCSLLLFPVNAQKNSVSGRITDKASGERISFATIRVAGKPNGTTANAEGLFELKLPDGKYTFIASCIGFQSDSITVTLPGSTKKLDFQLRPIAVHLPGVLITPGMNPANAIILKAIERKKIRNASLHSYVYYATSKTVLRAPEELKMNDNSASASLGYSDTSKMKIGAIFENQSKGYFLAPSRLKEEIIARKQTANLPPSVNMLTGGRIIQDFYSDDIKFFNSSVTGPLADGALDYYYFDLLDSSFIDNKKILKVHMSPVDLLAPGFSGDIFIEGSTYNLTKVDLLLNRAANIGSFFDTIRIVQQFLPFGEQNICMPVDYRLMLNLRYFSLFKLNVNIESILYEYEINAPLSEDLFTKAIITVLPTADKKDSTYWTSAQGIVASQEEHLAYQEIDSIKQVNKTKKQKFSFTDASYALNDSITLPAPLGMYRFNKVEGHTIKAEATGYNMYDQRLNLKLNYAYGFGDKRWKGRVTSDYFMGTYRTTHLRLSIFRDIKQQFGKETLDDNLIATVVNLCSKFETDNYYYNGGMSFHFESELFPVFALRLGYLSSTDETAITSAPPPLFFKHMTYNENDMILDGTYRFLVAGFKLDFRDYIEDGFHRNRIGELNQIPVITFRMMISRKQVLSSASDFALHSLEIKGALKAFSTNTLSYLVKGYYGTGSVPYQYLTTVPGNYDGIFEPNTIRSLQINKFLGDRGAFLNLEYSAGTSLWKLLHLSFLQKADIQLLIFGNASLNFLSDQSKQVFLKEPYEFKSPFYECGFGINYPLLPLRLECAWKLNYRDNSNFRIGVNTPLY
jgi:hypothetical protein